MNRFSLIVLITIVAAGIAGAQTDKYLPVWRSETRLPLVALTFDDGPKPEYSLPILDILDRYDVKATFFVVGKVAKQYPDIVYRMASSGHDVGSHTYSHIRLDSIEPAKVREELELTSQILEKITGTAPRFFRPPGGRFNRIVLEEVNNTGLTMINWSVNAADFTPHTEIPNINLSSDWQDIVSRVVSQLRAGDIILFHNGGIDTEKALPVIIEKIREKGYRLVTVSELLEARDLYQRRLVDLR